MKRHQIVFISAMIFLIILASIALAAPPWKRSGSSSTGSTSSGGTATTTTTQPIKETVIINNNNTIIQAPAASNENVGIWSNWVQILGGLLAVIVALIGWYFSRRARGKTAQYMTEIDKVYYKHNKNTNKCEAELTAIKETIEEDFKNGKINDQSLAILDKRIDKYAKELRSGIIGKKFTSLPEDMGKTIKHMLSDGVITKEEYDHFSKALKGSKMSSKDKEELDQLMKKWKKEDRR